MSTSLTGSRGASGNVIPKGYSAGQLQQFTPEQMGLFQQLFGHVSTGSQLSRQASGDLSGFAPQEQLAHRDFQALQGNIASRFSGGGGGPGAMSARRGSGFQNMQTQGAQDFATQLAAQRQGLQRQALLDLMGISESLLGQRPQEKFLAKKPPTFWQSLAGGLGQVAGIVPSAYFASKGIESGNKSGGGGSGMDSAQIAQLAALLA